MALAPRTEFEYRAALKRIGLVEGAQIPHRIDQSHWKDLSNSARVVLRAAIRWAWREIGDEATGQRLASSIPDKHEIKRVKKFPTRAEIERFVAEARNLESPRRELLLFDVSLGLRREEMLMLERSAVEEAVRGPKLLRFVRKGGREVEMPAAHVEKQLRALLRMPSVINGPSLKQEAPEWAYLYEVLGSTFRAAYEKLKRTVVATAKAAGCSTKWTPHTMRHAFATELVRDGANLAVVQAAMNHASYQTTQKYIHIDATDLQTWLKPRGE